jgi:hypothetical protein
VIGEIMAGLERAQRNATTFALFRLSRFKIPEKSRARYECQSYADHLALEPDSSCIKDPSPLDEAFLAEDMRDLDGLISTPRPIGDYEVIPPASAGMGDGAQFLHHASPLFQTCISA